MVVKASATISLIRVNDGATGPQGIPGPKGADGKQYYTWLKYADTPTTGMSDTPTNKNYIGLAYNKTTASESNTYSDYTWSLIKGEKGDTGLTGPKGTNGVTTYVWIKYATNASGANMSDSPSGKTYIGIAYNKTTATESTVATDYAWSLIKGDTGATGPPGTSITVKTTSVTYQVSSSGTTTPTGTWLTAVPATTPGQYLWTKTVVTYSDNKSTTAYSVSRSGTNGTNGSNGSNGSSITISSTSITYQVSSSGTTPPTGTWVTTIPGTSAGQYLWTRTIVTYSDNKSTTSYSVSRHGLTGPQGPTGKGVKSHDVEFYQSISATSLAGGSWVTTAPAWVNGKYIWSRNRITYTDDSVMATAAVCITGGKGNTGNTGGTGATGATGTGVQSITEQYYLSTSKTTQSGGSWVTTAPTWSTGKYMWTRVQIIYKNPASTVYTPPICDSSWEAVNEIEVGGKNLALNSKYEKVQGSEYLILKGTLSEPWIVGETYAILIKGECVNNNDMYSGVGLWRDDGMCTIDTSILYDSDKDLYIRIFKCPNAHNLDLTHNNFTIYNYPQATAVSAKIDWIKIVRGNKFSYDWTPAPEDIDDKFEDANDSINEVIKSTNTLLEKQEEKIIASVEEKYYSKDDTDRLVGEVSTALEITAKGIDMNFTSYGERLDDVNDATNAESKERKSLIRFVDGKIVLGLEGNKITLVEQNDRISFMENGTLEVAYFSNGKLYVADGDFTQSLTIGKFAFVPRSNGSLDFKKVGS